VVLYNCITFFVNVVMEGDDMRNIKVFLYKDNISYDLNKHITKTYNVDSVEYVYINNFEFTKLPNSIEMTTLRMCKRHNP